MDLGTAVVPIELDDGSTILIEATRLDEAGGPAADALPSIGDVTRLLEQVGKELWSAVKAISPDKAALEVGIEVGLKGGFLTAILVQNSAKANLKLTLEWDRASAGAGGS